MSTKKEPKMTISVGFGLPMHASGATAPRTLIQTKMTTLDHILKVSKLESAVLMAYEVGDDKNHALGHVRLRCECGVHTSF